MGSFGYVAPGLLSARGPEPEMFQPRSLGTRFYVTLRFDRKFENWRCREPQVVVVDEWLVLFSFLQNIPQSHSLHHSSLNLGMAQLSVKCSRILSFWKIVLPSSIFHRKIQSSKNGHYAFSKNSPVLLPFLNKRNSYVFKTKASWLDLAPMTTQKTSGSERPKASLRFGRRGAAALGIHRGQVEHRIAAHGLLRWQLRGQRYLFHLGEKVRTPQNSTMILPFLLTFELFFQVQKPTSDGKYSIAWGHLCSLRMLWTLQSDWHWTYILKK